MGMNEHYKKITGNRFRTLNTSVTAYSSKPKESDYEKGYVTRYFAQKTNDKGAPIYEVSSDEANRLNTSVMYVTTSLRWRITGPRDTVYNSDGKVISMGVQTSNEKSIELASNIITELKLYLPNKLQYHRS